MVIDNQGRSRVNVRQGRTLGRTKFSEQNVSLRPEYSYAPMTDRILNKSLVCFPSEA